MASNHVSMSTPSSTHRDLWNVKSTAALVHAAPICLNVVCTGLHLPVTICMPIAAESHSKTLTTLCSTSGVTFRGSSTASRAFTAGCCKILAQAAESKLEIASVAVAASPAVPAIFSSPASEFIRRMSFCISATLSCAGAALSEAVSKCGSIWPTLPSSACVDDDSGGFPSI